MNSTNTKVLWGAGSLVLILAFVYALTRLNQKAPEDQADAVEQIDCAGKPVFRYKYPTRMFPVVTRDYATNSKVTTDLLSSLLTDSSANFSLDVEATNTAKSLREQLNQDNIFFENQLKAIFFEVNRKPCDDSLSSLYTGYIKEMSLKTLQLKQFLAEITEPVSQSDPSDTVSTAELIIVDTFTAEVKQPSTEINPSDLIVVKSPKKINKAILGLDKKLERNVVRHTN